MKKLFLVFAAATLFVGVQACKQKAEEATEEVTDAATEATETVTEAVAEVADSTQAVVEGAATAVTEAVK